MELVYLWHDYDTTIQCANQFNFGSRYNFYFSNDGYLHITENTDYVEKLYADNISVSAIVGPNGVGKSQLLKLIWNGITHEQYFAIVLIENEFRLIGADYNGGPVLPLLNEEDGLSVEKIEIEIIDEDINLLSLSNSTSFLFTNEAVCYDRLESNFTITQNQKFRSMECNVKRIIDHAAKSNINIITEIKKIRNMTVHKGVDQGIIDTKIIRLSNQLETNIVSYEKMRFDVRSEVFERAIEIIFDNDIPWYEDMQKPESISIEIDESKWKKFIRTSSFSKSILNDNSTISTKVLVYYTSLWFSGFEKDSNTPIAIREKYLSIYQEYFDGKNIVSGNLNDLLEKLQEEYSYHDKGRKDKVHFSFAKKYFMPLQKLYMSVKEVESPNQTDSLGLTITESNKNNIVVIAEAHREVIRNAVNIEPLLNFGLSPFLSSGHQYTLDVFATLHDSLNAIRDKNVLLLLDEVEMFLHPNWQRNFLNLLINFLSHKYKEKNIHVILATHSPFILSDIPRDNIAFMGGELEQQQTFGANIHTLLSNGFFMQNGLMGEYAKEKIEDVINFLTDNATKLQSHEEAENIINIIGEPVLKMRLEKMLSDYKFKKNINIEEEINRKIEALKLQLTEIKNGQN